MRIDLSGQPVLLSFSYKNSHNRPKAWDARALENTLSRLGPGCNEQCKRYWEANSLNYIDNKQLLMKVMRDDCYGNLISRDFIGMVRIYRHAGS